MNRFISARSITAMAGLFLAGASNAGILTYEFGGGSDDSTTLTRYDTTNSLAVQVSGLDENDDAANIHRRNDSGWGVEGDPTGNRIGLNESLLFDWLPDTVTLLRGIVFEKGDDPVEKFDLYVDTVLKLDDFMIPNGSGDSLQAISFTTTLRGSQFQFLGQTPNTGGGGNKGFRISQLTVSVPEPTSAIMLILGLLGFGATRRA